MKNVILITSTFPSERAGGVPSYVENRALYLSKRIFVKVYGLGESYKQDNVEFQSIGRSYNFKFLFLIIWLRLIFISLKHRNSIIEIHNISVGFPLFFLFRCRYFFHGPARLEASVEGKSRINQQVKYWVERICLALSSEIFVVSKAFKDLLVREHRQNFKHASVILPKFQYKSMFYEEWESNTDHLKFVIVRRLVKRTGVVPFVRLFITMLESGVIPHDSELIIAGDGPEKYELMDIINNSSYGKNIIYIGFVSEENKIELFKNADYNIVPTVNLEGFGLVIIEAGIAGCMSIVSNVDAMPEVISYLSDQGIVYDLKHSKSIDAFKGLTKNLYDKKRLHETTKKVFYFE